jgi:hypothetical protein
MAAHSLETLLRLWGLDNLTTEQAIGQILQILNDLELRTKRLEQSVVALQFTSPAPTPPPDAPPAPPSANPPKRPRQ